VPPFKQTDLGHDKAKKLKRHLRPTEDGLYKGRAARRKESPPGSKRKKEP